MHSEVENSVPVFFLSCCPKGFETSHSEQNLTSTNDRDIGTINWVNCSTPTWLSHKSDLASDSVSDLTTLPLGPDQSLNSRNFPKGVKHDLSCLCLLVFPNHDGVVNRKREDTLVA